MPVLQDFHPPLIILVYLSANMMEKFHQKKIKKWYLYRGEDMKNFLKKHIGVPPIKGQFAKDFGEMKGIIIFSY